MCGIAGIIGASPPHLIRRMTNALTHRGPDSVGYYSAFPIQLGFRRLKIVDPDGGDQPIFNEAADKCVICNGEIYNYRPLRIGLSASGHRFRTASDTEVILHLYEDCAADCVQQLRGMFAFAIVDGNSVLLGRDPFGIKPLYYCHLPESNRFLFASEIKAILQDEGFTPRINERKLVDLIYPGYPIGEETFIDRVKVVKPGHVVKVSYINERLLVEQRRYFSLDSRPDPAITVREAKEAIACLLQKSVEAQLAADVDVTIALSGGVDSSLIAMLAEMSRSTKLMTFTFGTDRKHPDIVTSRIIANRIGANHNEVIIDFDDYLNALPGCLTARETPCGTAGLNVYLLSREITRHAKVSLMGEGADELFGGYAHYIYPERQKAVWKHKWSQLPLHASVRGELAAFKEQVEQPTDPSSRLDWLFRINTGDQLTHRHLEPVDACAMAWGVEMRVPFLDQELVSYLFRVPDEVKVAPEIRYVKPLLKQVATDLFGSAILPAIERFKLSFPDSSRGYYDRVKVLCADLLPKAYHDNHPLRHYFPTRHGLAVMDLFHHIFIQNRGLCPAGFSVKEFIRSLAV